MFGKLMKHELYASGRIMLPIGGILLVIAGMTNLAGRNLASGGGFALLNVMSFLVMTAFFLGCFAISIVSLVIMIKRFRDSILTDQGYLTNTLPVSYHSLILSRLLTALIYFLFVSLVILLAVFLAGIGTDFYRSAWNGLQMLMSEHYVEEILQQYAIGSVLWKSALISLISLIKFCLLLYLAMSIGFSFANHKGLLSFVMYFAVASVSSTISNSMIQPLLQRVEDFAHFNSQVLTILLIQQLAFCAVYYFATEYMLKKHLNLP